MSFTKSLSSMMPAFSSKMQVWLSPFMSVDTTSSFVKVTMPFIVVREASSIVAQISAYVVGRLRRAVRSTTETSFVGTRKLMPVSLPLSSGITSPTALAAPVVEGMMLLNTERPVR